MREPDSQISVRQGKREARTRFLSLYASAMFTGLVFAGGNTFVVAYAYSVRAWGWLIIFSFLSIANLGTFLLPKVVNKIYGEACYASHVANKLLAYLVLLWVGNIILGYIYVSSLWVL